MNFEREFENWLSTALQVPVPEEVKAFSFNLFEPAGEEEVKFGIELIGAGNYDPDDSDWACDEVWEPKQRRLFIPPCILRHRLGGMFRKNENPCFKVAQVG